MVFLQILMNFIGKAKTYSGSVSTQRRSCFALVIIIVLLLQIISMITTNIY